jgi:3'-phosphoadenosine 5'-phosphosulfate sulfotransferase (PAPS reductase)/FAD synthetase
MKVEMWQLRQRQGLPLELKIKYTEHRITAWYNYWGGEIYVSFSGGLDSTVLLAIARSLYPEIPAVFADTGLEYPEIRSFVKTWDNVEWMKPKIGFKEVLAKYGYPVVSKNVSRFINDLQRSGDQNKKTVNLRLTGMNQSGVYCPSQKIPKKYIRLAEAPFKISEKCCDVMKKRPFHQYEKQTGRKGMSGTMADESLLRERQYLKNGCQSFESKHPLSQPIAFWLHQDILQYIKQFDLPYSSIYGEIKEGPDGKLFTTGEQRTGCMFCMFGVHLEKGENRFQRMERTHPKIYEYCINDLGLSKVMDYIGVSYRKEISSQGDLF